MAIQTTTVVGVFMVQLLNVNQTKRRTNKNATREQTVNRKLSIAQFVATNA